MIKASILIFVITLLKIRFLLIAFFFSTFCQKINLADPNSPEVQKLVSTLRSLHLELADLFPPVVQISESPAVAKELLVQLRLLQTTIQVKLAEFDPRTRGRFGSVPQQSGGARRRS